jgi:HEAT repeat protein
MKPLVALLSAGCLLAAACGARAAPPPDPAHVAALVRDLDSDDFAVREKADKELRQMGSAAKPLLREALKQADSLEVRLRLERILRVVTPEERIAALIRQLGDDDYEVREKATQALRDAGPSLLPALKAAEAATPDPEVRARLQAVIRSLSK